MVCSHWVTLSTCIVDSYSLSSEDTHKGEVARNITFSSVQVVCFTAWNKSGNRRRTEMWHLSLWPNYTLMWSFSHTSHQSRSWFLSPIAISTAMGGATMLWPLTTCTLWLELCGGMLACAHFCRDCISSAHPLTPQSHTCRLRVCACVSLTSNLFPICMENRYKHLHSTHPHPITTHSTHSCPHLTQPHSYPPILMHPTSNPNHTPTLLYPLPLLPMFSAHCMTYNLQYIQGRTQDTHTPHTS